MRSLYHRQRRRHRLDDVASLPDVAVLNTALGGTLYACYDVRSGLAPGAVSSWPDFLGNGPACVQAVGAKQPDFDGTTVNFDGTDDVLISAVHSGFSLDVARGIIVVGAINGVGALKYAGLIRNAAVDRFLGIVADTTVITGKHADSAGTVTQATLVNKSTTIRCVIAKQRTVTSRLMATKVFDQTAVTAPAPTGTVAAEDKLLELGGLDSATLYSTSKLRAVLVSTAVYWTGTQQDFINAWALANHGSVNA